MNNLDENFFVSGENKKNSIDSFLNGDEKYFGRADQRKWLMSLEKHFQLCPSVLFGV